MGRLRVTAELHLIEDANASTDQQSQSKVWTDIFTPHAVHELLFNPTHLGPPSFLAVALAGQGSPQRSTVWVDPSATFYPPASRVCLERLHVLRPRPADSGWTAVECLRCKQVGVVVAVMLQRPTRVEVRRLQLAAEHGGGVGILLRPNTASAGSHIYAAASRWLVSPAPGERTIQRWRIDHVHGHGRHLGPSFIVEKHRETDTIHFVHPPAALADTRRLRRHPECRPRAVAIIHTVGQRRVVACASFAARKVGIKPGMTAAEARALHGNLLSFDDDPPADRRALEALGRWLTRFTPIVSCEWDGDVSDPPAALWLDLTGCERLFGGIGRLADSIAQALRRFDIPSGIAVAPTVGSAWALASTTRRSLTVVTQTQLPHAIGPLPIETLRLHDESLGDLHDLGLRTVGHVLALPREQLPSRFGPLLNKRLDQLTGAMAEPLTKLIYDPPVTASRRFDAPIESPEQVVPICEQLLQSVLTELARRGHGVRLLRLVLTPDRGWGRAMVKREIALSRPHRHHKTLLELIGREIERTDCEHGFVAFRLDVPGHEAVAETQDDLFEQQPHAEQMEFELLLQRLRGRLGEAAVIRPHLVESHLPERAWRPARDGETAVTAFAWPMPPRPLMLFPTPIELLVVCEPSDDRTGRPRQFTWQREIYRLLHVVGPERIAGEWWRGHKRTRDYFDVEDDTGRRFWIFRVLSIRPPDRIVARWFLHGRFD